MQMILFCVFQPCDFVRHFPGLAFSRYCCFVVHHFLVRQIQPTPPVLEKEEKRFRDRPPLVDNVNLPSCSWFIVTAVYSTSATGERVARHVGVTLTTEVVVRTRVFVVVAGMVGCDVLTLEVFTGVS